MRDYPENITSKYKFVTVAARRCAQLLSGAKPRIESKGMVKFTTVAMNEVLDDKVVFIDDPEKHKEEAAENEQEEKEEAPSEE